MQHIRNTLTNHTQTHTQTHTHTHTHTHTGRLLYYTHIQGRVEDANDTDDNKQKIYKKKFTTQGGWRIRMRMTKMLIKKHYTHSSKK